MSAPPVIAQGKALLIRAAMKLALKTRSIRALGVREVGREAGLNPNTFYRHFTTMDDLGLAVVTAMLNDLREPVRELRRQAAAAATAHFPAPRVPAEQWTIGLRKGKVVAREAVRVFFDFAVEKPEPFLLSVSELNGSSPVLRQTFRRLLADIAADLAEDIRLLELLPMLSDEAVEELSTGIVRLVFSQAPDYIEEPAARDEILTRGYRAIVTMATGAIALEVTDQAMLAELLAIARDED